MNTITRSIEQPVATVDVDDAGYVEIQVTVPLTVDEARDVADAILQAADRGEQYLTEESAAAAAGNVAKVEAWCTVCQAPAVRDVLSSGGWRHLHPVAGVVRHVARADEAAL